MKPAVFCDQSSLSPAARTGQPLESIETVEIIYPRANLDEPGRAPNSAAPYLIVNKPGALPVHPNFWTSRGSSTGTLTERIEAQLSRPVNVVHRLDAAASGLLVVALDAQAAAALGKLFETALVAKYYLALVRGWAADYGECDRPIRAEGKSRYRPALTRYECLERLEIPDRPRNTRLSLLRVRTWSGRHHQIRRHLRQLGHPLLGDTVHGPSEFNRLGKDALGCTRLFLHCYRLRLPDPWTDRMVDVEAPLEASLARVLDRARPSKNEGNRSMTTTRTTTSSFFNSH